MSPASKFVARKRTTTRHVHHRQVARRANKRRNASAAPRSRVSVSTARSIDRFPFLINAHIRVHYPSARPSVVRSVVFARSVVVRALAASGACYSRGAVGTIRSTSSRARRAPCGLGASGAAERTSLSALVGFVVVVVVVVGEGRRVRHRHSSFLRRSARDRGR